MTILRWPDLLLAEVCAPHKLDQFDGLMTFDRVNPAKRAALEAEYAGVVA